ncbi:MAG: hypothetical protein ILP07_11190 [Treponema sp.]|nr:hypothetical protein [Treponema sp.]
MKTKFCVGVRLVAFAVIVWMLPMEALFSVYYIYVSRDFLTAKDIPAGLRQIGTIILRNFVGYLILATVLVWGMEIPGVTLGNLLIAFIAWALTLFLPLNTPDIIQNDPGMYSEHGNLEADNIQQQT